MSELPRGWGEDEAWNICELVQSGGTPKEGFIDKPGVPFLKVYNIVDQKIDFEYRPQFIDVGIHRSSMAKSQAYPGDVLMNIVGPPLGKVAVIPDSFPTWNVNQALTIFRPSEAVTSEWLYYFLCGGNSVKSVINETRGSAGQVNISLSQCRAFKLPLPPLAEQKRIVAKLDVLNAKSACARTELARIKTLVSRYKQAVLSKAFSGELTSDVSTWTSCTLGDLALDVRYGTAEKCTYAPDLIPVLRIPNVANGRIDVSDLKHASFNEKELRKLALLEGDLLIIRSNGSLDLVGRSAVVDAAAAGMLFAGYLIRVRLDLSKAIPSFIHYWMQSFAVRRIIEDAAKSTSGVNNVNSQQLQALQLNLPPLEKQREIVRRIESAFAKIDRLAKEAKRALELVGRLDEVILAKAFRGELVPQDENDEPADHLLSRIRAEREKAPKARRGRKIVGQ